MTAGEDQPQAIVRNFFGEVIRLLDCRIQLGCVGFNFLVEPRLAPQAVNRFVAGRLDNPCGRGFRDAGGAPLIDGGGKRFLGGFFGYIEITEIPN